MELKINDRDYVADGMGGLVRVSGWDELLERVLFKLSVRRGSFSLLPELGSRVTIEDPERLLLNQIPLEPVVQFYLDAPDSFRIEAHAEFLYQSVSSLNR